MHEALNVAVRICSRFAYICDLFLHCSSNTNEFTVSELSHKQVCVQPPTAADKVALPAFAAARRAAADRYLLPAGLTRVAAVGPCWDRHTDGHRAATKTFIFTTFLLQRREAAFQQCFEVSRNFFGEGGTFCTRQ